MRLLPILVLCVTIPAIASARDGLRDIVHPSADVPAFRCLVPEDWKNEVDPTGNLLLSNSARTAFFSLSFAHASNPAEAHDALARAILGNAANPPWESREPAEISGHRGFRYTAHIKSANATVRAEVLIVEAGEGHLAAVSAILSERIKPDDESTARLVLAATKLVTAP